MLHFNKIDALFAGYEERRSKQLYYSPRLCPRVAKFLQDIVKHIAS